MTISETKDFLKSGNERHLRR